MVFDLARFPGSCTRWQLGDGGVQPPPGPHFWGVRAEAQMCSKHCFFLGFSAHQCLGTFRKTWKYQDFWMLTSQKHCNLHWFLALEWSKQRYLQDFVFACALLCSLMGSEGRLRCRQNTAVYEVFCLLLSYYNFGNYHTRNYYLGTLKFNTRWQI